MRWETCYHREAKTRSTARRMSIYLADRIEKPKHFKLAPLHSSRGKRAPYCIGFDSEAESGYPFLYQFAHPNEEVDLVTVPRKKYSGLTYFFDYLRDTCTRKDVEYIVGGFNLMYEWTQLFGEIDDELKNADEFRLNLSINGRERGVLVRTLNEKRYTLTAEFGRLNEHDEFEATTHRRVKMIDIMAFLTMSLDEAGEIIGVGRKLTKPKRFSRKNMNDPDFIEYAKQDARITQRLTEYIVSLHQKYDVTTCVSAPHFAAKTFRRHYLSKEIPLPATDLEQHGLWSYHGGKNGFYLPKPSLRKNVYHFDIRSAYPEAMTQLPNLEEAEWRFSKKYVKSAHAVWHIKGVLKDCTYRSLQAPGGEYLTGGEIETYATGYEVDTAIELGELELTECSGYMMIGKPGGPLLRYVNDFYRMKRNAKTSGERATAKLFLNSLYGKFFQKVPLGKVGSYDFVTGEQIITDPEQDYDYEAGGLYHPPIASLITGFVRAKIHRLEHKYDSLMTSTDGFFANSPADPSDLGEEYGELECQRGNLRIWRERCYIFESDELKKPLYAMHGFRGKLAQLRRMPLRAGSLYEYEATQMVTLRMSLIRYRSPDGRMRRFRPGQFVDLTFGVKLPPALAP